MDANNGPANSKLSEPEVAALMRGSKLGFLLAVLNLPEKAKDELASLTEDMTIDQLDRLLDILEAKYLNEKTADADKKLIKELEPLAKKYAAEDNARAKKLAAALNRI
jgi:hypothetical protein